MSREVQFECALPNGIHARPASALEEVTRNFSAETSLINERTGYTANAKSVLAIVGADIRQGDRCRLVIGGRDADEAWVALRHFLQHKFPHCDVSLPGPVTMSDEIGELPRLLRQAGGRIHPGKPVVNGIGHGRLRRGQGLHLSKNIPLRNGVDVEAEVRRLDAALAALGAEYEIQLRRQEASLGRDLLKAHRAMARDPEFWAYLHESIRKDSCSIAGAVLATEAHFSKQLIHTGQALLRERVLDLHDVCFQLLQQVYGSAAVSEQLNLTEATILVAEALTPNQLLSLDRRHLRGLILGMAGETSHTVILARSFGIPTLTGVVSLGQEPGLGTEAILDGECGLLVTEITGAVRRYYELERRRLTGRQRWLRRFARPELRSTDGTTIRVGANITAAVEAEVARSAGADEIGLFRTEMLFLDRATPPTEDEQFAEYQRAVRAMEGRAVVIRTLDIGGDKPLTYLNLPVESNPFLGYRAVRLYPEFETLFRTQVRALIRASAFGQLKLLIPLVSLVEEVQWARRIIREEQEQLRSAGVRLDPMMSIGAMIEVPAAAFSLDALGRELDFFSIGSNDLLQYFAAADRTDQRLSRHFDPLHPAFLRLLHQIATTAQAAGKPVGVCGEMSGRLECVPLLMGLGLERSSVAISRLAPIKAEVTQWSVAAARELATRALACATAAEVRRILAEATTRRTTKLFGPDLVIVDSDSASKEEVIKEVTDRLYVTGRTAQPRLVEAALWQRESVYATGFGHGFAIPHCQTDFVQLDSLILVKLREPVEWKGVDGEPVGVVLLLVMRETGTAREHLKIFSQLARRLMDEKFREQLRHENDPETLCSILKCSLRE
ncbi:MAG: phosphoenolpyruvate--protein phosphotransferase [Verrucomicrobiae bacterium]|nr:phosphoenolpyruvate--protein phosphotransferase [Verrucomicrobiae bacterium]